MPTPSGFLTQEERALRDQQAEEEADRRYAAAIEQGYKEWVDQINREKEILAHDGPDLDIPVDIAEEFLSSLGLKDVKFSPAERLSFSESESRDIPTLKPGDYTCRVYESSKWEDVTLFSHSVYKQTGKGGLVWRQRGEDIYRRTRFNYRSGHSELTYQNKADGLKVMIICLADKGQLEVLAFGLARDEEDFQLLADTMSRRTGKSVSISATYNHYQALRFARVAFARAKSKNKKARSFWPSWLSRRHKA